MILLASATDYLQIAPDGATTLHANASWVDYNAGAITPGRLNTSFSTATSVVPGPSSGQRALKTLHLWNPGGGGGPLATVISVKIYDATAAVLATVFTLALGPGEALQYHANAGWQRLDNAGNVVRGPERGRLLLTTLLTASSGTFSVGTGTSYIALRGVGGGGAGGGCTSVASAAGAAGGGGAGGYVEDYFATTPGSQYAYMCGAAGAGASGAGGGNGGTSRFTGPQTYYAYGGNGAAVATSVNALSRGVGGRAGLSIGYVAGAGGNGDNGIVVVVTGPVGVSGAGGSGPFGGGGAAVSAAGNGVAATGYGAGGSGALTGVSAARAGGNGSPGCWVVEEYTG